MAENNRGQEGRPLEGPGQMDPANGRSRHQAPEGFEGMNYEQRREPYRGGRRNTGGMSPGRPEENSSSKERDGM
jgi:hypothetical protein